MVIAMTQTSIQQMIIPTLFAIMKIINLHPTSSGKKFLIQQWVSTILLNLKKEYLIFILIR